MRKRTWILILACLSLLLAIVFFRWPRIEHEGVMVDQSAAGRNTVELQYRMRRPFQVAVTHMLSEKDAPPPGTGIHVGGSKILRKERVALFSSRHDLLRDEYVVTLRLVKDEGWQAEANGERIPIALWCGKPGHAAEFLPVSPLGGQRVLR